MLDFMPPKRTIGRQGTIREVRRQGIAYVSNLAVAPQAQRQGIGAQLLERSEALAAAWGCRSVALHVDPENVPAVELYRRAGYRFVMKQPEWQRFVEGRATALSLMMRALPFNTRRRKDKKQPGKQIHSRSVCLWVGVGGNVI